MTSPTPTEPAAKKRQMSFHALENGDVVASFDGLDNLTLPLSSIPDAIRIAAVTEGLISRARSATGRYQDTDRTPENLRSAVAEAFANLQNGIWRTERASGQGSTDFPIEVIAAFEFRKGKTLAAGKEFTDTLSDVAAMWDGLTDDQKKAVKALPRYQAAYATEKSRRAAEKAERLLKKAIADETAAAI